MPRDVPADGGHVLGLRHLRQQVRSRDGRREDRTGPRRRRRRRATSATAARTTRDTRIRTLDRMGSPSAVVSYVGCTPLRRGRNLTRYVRLATVERRGRSAADVVDLTASVGLESRSLRERLHEGRPARAQFVPAHAQAPARRLVESLGRQVGIADGRDEAPQAVQTPAVHHVEDERSTLQVGQPDLVDAVALPEALRAQGLLQRERRTVGGQVVAQRLERAAALDRRRQAFREQRRRVSGPLEPARRVQRASARAPASAAPRTPCRRAQERARRCPASSWERRRGEPAGERRSGCAARPGLRRGSGPARLREE